MPRWPTRISVCTASGLSMTIDALGRRRRLGRRERRHLARRPVAERASRRPPSPRRRSTSPTMASSALLGTKNCLWKSTKSCAGQRGQRFRRAAAGHAVGMEAVDQAIDHLARRRCPDPRRRPCSADSACCRCRSISSCANVGRRTTSAIRSSASAQAVLHHDGVDVAEVGAGAGAEHAADEVDRRRRSARRSCAPRPDRAAPPSASPGPCLPFGILRRAGANDHAHADGRLLVLADQHDLQAVGQLADLVRRERDRPRRQRPRRALASAIDRAGACGAPPRRRSAARRHTSTPR